MKKLIAFIIAVVVLLTGCTPIAENKKLNENKVVQNNSQISAVWIYYDELSMVDESGGTETSFREKVQTMFENCVEWGINTLFIQVRPCADSFHKSDIFPWTYYLTGEQGRGVSYDPLGICIEEAHERGLSVHAWINPFRIAFGDDISLLSDDHSALTWIKNKTDEVVFVNGGIYFSPASPEAQKLVLEGVREIVYNYDVDGIHIDDYFYPSTESIVDEAYYKKYTESGGKLNLEDWRLNTISAFVSQMYNVTKSKNKDCIFSVSPAGNIQNNYEQQFADVRRWCSSAGYADWIIPQLYYGFESKILPFDKALSQWVEIHDNPDVKMIYGIGAYRVNEDEEWKAGSGIIAKQLELIRNNSSSSGVAYFSYSSLEDEKRSAEFTHFSTSLS